MDFDSVARRVFDLYWEQRYDEALRLVDEARSDHPQEDGRLTYFQACLLGVSGRPLDALDALENGLDRGLWWVPDLLADSDLESVRSLPSWERLERRCTESAERFMADHEPRVQIRPGPVENTAGTLITLHGAGVDPLVHMKQWASAVPESWTLIAPEGTAPYSATQRAWPRDHPASVVLAQLEGVAVVPPVVLSGFSQGGGVAAFMAWDGVLDPAGLILVAPPLFRSRVWDPQVDRQVPTYILVGGEDHSLADSVELQRRMHNEGAHVHLDHRSGLGHELPDDFSAAITAALDWISDHQTSLPT